MEISILCSSSLHPVNGMLAKWINNNSDEHHIELQRITGDLSGGDVLFLISCGEIVTREIRDKYTKTLVIHASDLPSGRGWSPHVWSVIDGKTEIFLSLLEAEDCVDTGDIWNKMLCKIPKDMLYEEINQVVFETESELMDFAIQNFDNIEPLSQQGDVSYFPKRTPKDSLIDVNIALKEQFDLIRVCDPERYPAFFELHGHKYRIKLEKIFDE